MLSFDEIGDLFHNLQVSLNPAAYHGQLCGQACGGMRLGLEQLLNFTEELLGLEPEQVSLAEDEFQRYYQDLLGQLGGDDFSFQLCLPDDDLPLAERTRAFGIWCGHFLSGLGESGLSESHALSEEAAEVLQDFSALSHISAAVDGDDSEEVEFTELVEYVRVGVQLLYSELGQGQQHALDADVTYH